MFKKIKIIGLCFSAFIITLPIHLSYYESLWSKDNSSKNVTKIIKGGNIEDNNDQKESTEEEKNIVKKKFWIEFGVSAAFLLIMIIAISVYIYFHKKRKGK